MQKFNEGKKQDVLQFIKRYQNENGKSPSYRQIMHALGMVSLSMVNRYVSLLESEGLVFKNELGGIKIPTHLETGNVVMAPLVGTVACGQPTYAEDNIQGNYALPTAIFGGGKTILLEAKGKSMVDAGIESGDLLVIKPETDFENGDMVVALIGDEATAKRIYFEGGKVILHPENAEMDDIVVNDISELEIKGRIVNIIKSVKRFKKRC